jgi:serine phosphatase RsbU (regulator of sigma subunit)
VSGPGKKCGFDDTTQTLKVPEPAQLIAYSDGVSEAEDAEGQQFGRQHLIETLCSVAPDQRMDHLQHTLRNHLAGHKAKDDMSIALLHCAQRS